ncbi:SET domain-containing protein [uncultured Pseudodesulfovibrio sp.]|uniref:SET domain-containing protein n=1 Tax=uncultured Pseudodesulfovibrio sp. TaxID=2035858 RepID=UPI0029C99816|nr:SET domain-containing protein [uncultured Pseudodesulfovibrio sp.]
MIHPHSVVRTVSPEIGVGVFATRHIPQGTIVVVRDQFDLCLSQEDYCLLPQSVRASMETYMYHDKCGNLVLSWDHARYMNHSCHSNTMMTDYNLEIAVRDISPGEEITTEYGLLNIQEPYEIYCGCDSCREHLRLDDIDVHGAAWDASIRASLLCVSRVEQPLLPLVNTADRTRLDDLLLGRAGYSSIMNLKWRACAGNF